MAFLGGRMDTRMTRIARIDTDKKLLKKIRVNLRHLCFPCIYLFHLYLDMVNVEGTVIFIVA